MEILKSGLEVLEANGLLSINRISVDKGYLTASLAAPGKTINLTYDLSRQGLTFASSGEAYIAKKISELGALKAIISSLTTTSGTFQDAKDFSGLGIAEKYENIPIFPIKSSDEGIVYQVADGRKFVHSGEDQKVSLLAFKGFQEANRLEDFFLVAGFDVRSPDFAPATALTSAISDEIAQKFAVAKYAVEPHPLNSEFVRSSIDNELPQVIVSGDLHLLSSDVALAHTVKSAAWNRKSGCSTTR